MTKTQLIELFRKSGAGGNTTPDTLGKLHPLVIEKYFELAYNTLMAEAHQRLRKNSDLDSYTKSYKVDVDYDTSREKYYSVLPASIISGDASVRLISALKDETYVVDMIDSNSVNVFLEMEVSKVDERPSGMLEGNKIYYVWFREDIEQVLMKLVVPFSEFGDNDNINIPGGRDVVLFDMVLKLMKKRR